MSNERANKKQLNKKQQKTPPRRRWNAAPQPRWVFAAHSETYGRQLVEILKGGVPAWNDWRRVTPDLYIDLRGAHLRGARLEKINLSVAHLQGADLSGADLHRADLHRANLKFADLSGANLSMANLEGAKLVGTKLPLDFKPEQPEFSTQTSKSAASTESTDARRSQNRASAAGSETHVVHDTPEGVFSVQDVQPTESGQTKEASETPFSVSKETSLQVMRPTSVAYDYLEGGKKERLSQYFERDPKLRMAALALHGTKCMVCGFDFEATYGVHGAGYAEVHHLRPVSSLQAKTKVNPQTDMVVLCANCHRMIHRNRDGMLSPDELRSLLRR